MYRSSTNSSSSASDYFRSECDPYDDGADAGKSGGPSTGLLILFTTYCFEFLVGAPLNLWLVLHILKNRSKVDGVRPADFFPLHLALTQLLFYLSLPLHFANHFLWQSSIIFTVMVLLNGMVIIMKPVLLCLVCVEKYMAVVRPLDYLRFKARKYRWGCLVVSWCIYVLMASTALFKRSPVLVCTLFIPVLVIDTICCLSVLSILRKPPPGDGKMMEKREKGKTHKNGSHVVTMEDGKHEQSGGKVEVVKQVETSKQRVKGEMNFMKRKAFFTILVIQAVLTLNYLPYIIILPMNGRVPARRLKCQYIKMSLAAAASCSYLQPLLYLHRLGKLPCGKFHHS